MIIYEIHESDGTSICFKGTKREAVKEVEWWTERGNVDVSYRAIRFKATKEGIAALMTTYAGGGGK